MERESNVLLVSSQAPSAHPSNQKRRMKRTRLHIEKRWSKTGLWIFLLNGDKHKMDIPLKKTNKQSRQNNAIGVVTRLEDSRAEQSWFDSREAQEIYLIFKPLY